MSAIEWAIVGIAYLVVALLVAVEVARRTPRPPRRVCAWCQRTVAPGIEPATHTICPACSAAIEGTAR